VASAESGDDSIYNINRPTTKEYPPYDFQIEETNS